jgi:hypothetical protein
MSSLTAYEAKNFTRSNHAGLCDLCRRWADEVSDNNQIIQLKIGIYAQKYLHLQAHYELLRLVKVRRGIWHSLPGYIQEHGEKDVGLND